MTILHTKPPTVQPTRSHDPDNTYKVYTAEPTLALFHLDHDSIFKYIEGPFGSGKSTGCLMELMMRGMQQQPDSSGVRRTRWAIIRQTYPELKSTTIKTFENWVPHDIAPVVFSIPIVSTFEQSLGDGTRVKIEFVFLALEGPEDVKKLLSFELTGAYINEAREVAVEIVENLFGRINRYPETVKNDEGEVTFGPTWAGIIADSNPPRTTHWLYEKFETGKTPPGWRKFKQPPAVYKDGESGEWMVNPEAENLSHLANDYYTNQMSAGDDFIRVNLGGEFGMSRKGKPVYSKFVESKHVAKTVIEPIRGLPVILGMDFGLTPATSLMQVTGRGVRILDELPASDETLEDYLDEYVLPLLLKRYSGYTIVASGDPAGNQRDRHTKQSDFSILRARKIKAFPAITNDPVQRIACVNWFLGRDEGFLISPHCTVTREAFGGGYVFKEQKNAVGQWTDTPVKNDFSHLADGNQYGCLYARYGARLEGGQTKQEARKPFLWA